MALRHRRADRLARLLQLLTAVALAGCCPEEDRYVSEATNCDDTFCGEPTVDVGDGLETYTPVCDGDDFAIVYGPQGGYHLEVGARMDGLCPIVRLAVSVRAADGTEVATAETRVQAVRDGPGTVQDYWGLQPILPCGWWPTDGPYDGPNPPECPDGVGLDGQIGGQEITIVVEATDDNGRTGRGEKVVVAECCVE